jgi:hypothetical protein
LFVPVAPCEASELVHFRNRIGESGVVTKVKGKLTKQQSKSQSINMMLAAAAFNFKKMINK